MKGVCIGMKRFSLSAGALVTAALAAALVAAAAFGGVTSSTPIYGQLDWLECIGASGCAATANVIGEPTGLVIGSEQDYVFAASHASNSVDTFTRDRKNGKLKQLAGAQGCVSETGDGGQCFDGRALVGPTDVINAENFLYVASDTSAAVSLFQRDPDSREWRQPNTTDGCVSETGTGGECVDGYALTGARSLELNANASKLWVGGTNTISWFERNKNTGKLKETGCISTTGSEGPGCVAAYVPGTVVDLAASSDKKHLYATVSGGGNGAVLEFSVFRGQLTEIGCVNSDGSNGCTVSPLLVNPEGLALDEKGMSLYVAANGSDTLLDFNRNRKTGLLTPAPAPITCYNPGGTGGCTAALGIADPHGIRVCENRGCVLVSAGDGVASFARRFKDGGLTQPTTGFPPFVPCFNLAGTGGCSQADGLGGAMGVDSIGGGIKQVYVAGSTTDSVSEFHLH
jgi:6-phosphogluconolactonase (cycloisomerase 2 family)